MLEMSSTARGRFSEGKIFGNGAEPRLSDIQDSAPTAKRTQPITNAKINRLNMFINTRLISVLCNTQTKAGGTNSYQWSLNGLTNGWNKLEGMVQRKKKCWKRNKLLNCQKEILKGTKQTNEFDAGILCMNHFWVTVSGKMLV